MSLENQMQTKYLDRNELIRVKEIFYPFFKTLEDYCLSYSIYSVSIQGLSMGGRRFVSFDFTVSTANGSIRKDSIMYNVDTTEIFYSDKFKFERGSEEKILYAVRSVIDGINTIPHNINKLTVEAGTSWVMGIIGKDIENGVMYDGYVMFLKSDVVFESYGLPSWEMKVC